MEFPGPVEARGVVLDAGRPSREWPRAFEFQFSPDGGPWQTLPHERVAVGPLRWDGRHLLRDGVKQLRIIFPRRRIKALRLILTVPSPLPSAIPKLRLLVS